MMLAGGARLEDIFAMVQRGEVATLNLIVKADAQGSLEAITDALRKLDQEHDEVRLSFVHRGVGGITESDVEPRRRCRTPPSSASTCGPTAGARELAEHENVEMRLYEVIYNVLEDVQQRARRHAQARVRGSRHRRRRGARGVLDPACRQGRRLLRQNGVITRGSKVRFLREGTVIWKGAIASLRASRTTCARSARASSAVSGSSNFQDLKPGDVIETFELREVART